MDDIETAEDAARLDRLLDRAVAPALPPALARRILADFDRIGARWTLARTLRRAADAIWPDAPLWQPAAAFAVALLVGLGAACFAPLDLAQSDDGGASVFALDSGPDVDLGQGL